MSPDDAVRPKGPELAILRLIATLGGHHTPIVLTSREIGEKLGVSQQAADRYLIALESRGLLLRQMAARRQRLSLPPSAMDLLRHEYQGYRRIFEGPATIRFTGTLQSGLGEGRYYLSQPGYVLQFTERLGYAPFPGTLNIGVPPDALAQVETVRHWAGVRIDGFQAAGRTFGGATCYEARLAGRACHAIIPDRTHHENVVEFVSPECLREALQAKDGDAIPVQIQEE
jgi:riboflavin kinase